MFWHIFNASERRFMVSMLHFYIFPFPYIEMKGGHSYVTRISSSLDIFIAPVIKLVDRLKTR